MCFLRRGLCLALTLTTTLLHAQSSVPSSSAPIPAQSFPVGAAAATVELRNHFTLQGVTGQIVQFDTVFGRLNVEMRSDAAPRHVANFLGYVERGAYSNSAIHRVAAFDNTGNAIVQGGGFTSTLSQIPTVAPVALEYNLPNARGTLAAARTNDINSATSQWYFNVKDNSSTLGQSNGGGYTVFGRVIGNGMAVIDQIALLPKSSDDYPLRNFTGGTPTLANLVIVNSISTATIYPTGTGASVLRFTASSSNPAVVTTAVNGTLLTVTPVGGGSASVTVNALDTNGGSATQTVLVTVEGSGGGGGGGGGGPSAPVITAQPQPQIRLTRGTGNTVVFSVIATGSPAPTYQWRRNGVAVSGEQRSTYTLANATEAMAGSFTCVVSNSAGSVESQPSVLSFATTAAADVGRLGNLAIRTNAGTGAQTLIVGFSLGGANTAGSSPILVRAVGPTLAAFGVSGALVDPKLEIFTGVGVKVTENDTWDPGLSSTFSAVGAFLLTPGSLDAALALAPARDTYTVQVTGRNNGTGIVLAEIYDAVPRSAFMPTTPRLINVSARTEVGAGSDILIAGFAIAGTTAKTVLIRAIGPTLAVFGVTETLSNPKLQLFSGTTVIAENDDWGGDPQLTNVATAVGAFRLENPASRDAVLMVTLPPGSYTAQVSGANAGTGVALVELYEVP